MAYYDMHVHTVFSHDGKQTVEQACEVAKELELAGIAVTDHVEMSWFSPCSTVKRIVDCHRVCDKAREHGGSAIEVSFGMELSGPFSNSDDTRKVMTCTDYDVILGSVHMVPLNGKLFECSQTEFGRSVSEQELCLFLDAYWQQVLYLTEEVDFDVLAHLTFPLRYICGKYGRQVSLQRYEKVISEILHNTIFRGIALEVNTSGLIDGKGEWMPSFDILQQYYRMGGRKITIGSDAHTADRIGNEFSRTGEQLTSIGFESTYFYKGRTPQKIEIVEVSSNSRKAILNRQF